MTGLIQLFRGLIFGLALAGSALQAQEQGMLWEQNPVARPGIELSVDEIRALGSSFREVFSQSDFDSLIQSIQTRNWEAVRQLFQRNSVSEFSDFLARRRSFHFSSLELALTLRVYRHVEERSAFRHPGAADNLGYFFDATRIIESNPSIDPRVLSKYSLDAEAAILMGLCQNPFVVRRLPEKCKYGKSYFQTLERLSAQAPREVLEITLLSSLVNPSSTGRLNREQMREQNELRDYQFSHTLADAIFQIRNLSDEDLKRFVTSGKLPDSFVRPHSVTFEKLEKSLVMNAQRKFLMIGALLSACASAAS